jgi:hypothetical protein
MSTPAFDEASRVKKTARDFRKNEAQLLSSSYGETAARAAQRTPSANGARQSAEEFLLRDLNTCRE